MSGMKDKFMSEAIRQAQKATETGEGMAFGAVIVKDGEIIASAHNSVSKDNLPTSHAEINAIQSACKKLGSSDLNGCTVYSTCEPCPMCFTATWWANIDHLVFGVDLEDVTGVSDEILVSSDYLNEKGGSKVKIERGFMKEECLKLYV